MEAILMGTVGPMTPTDRQTDFLTLECEEALFGGGVGGGKSEAGLMWLAQGIHLPTYSGLLLRKYATDLVGNDGLIDKSTRMYWPLGATLHGTNKIWTFPSGAKIQLKSIEHEHATQKFQGLTYHRVFFDELTHFSESQYEYVRGTRIRRPDNYPISLGTRASCNPDGQGRQWVKDRFITDEAIEIIKRLKPRDPTPAGLVCWKTGDRAFVPSRLADNPHINFDDYAKRLSSIPPVLRERLLNGDWSIIEGGAIKPEYIRYFQMQGEYYRCFASGRLLAPVVYSRECERFSIIDAAGSSKELDEEERTGKKSWTVISTFDYHRSTKWLMLRDVRRGKWEFPEQIEQTKRVNREQMPAWVGIEDASNGRPMLQHLQGSGISLRTLSHGGEDKLTRAAPWLLLASEGRFFVNEYAPWRAALEAEFFSWTGKKGEQADQIDTCAYGGIHCDSVRGGVIKMDSGFMFGRV
jgi:predicted phage terminase large subunit-like protein